MSFTGCPGILRLFAHQLASLDLGHNHTTTEPTELTEPTQPTHPHNAHHTPHTHTTHTTQHTPHNTQHTAHTTQHTRHSTHHTAHTHTHKTHTTHHTTQNTHNTHTHNTHTHKTHTHKTHTHTHNTHTQNTHKTHTQHTHTHKTHTKHTHNTHTHGDKRVNSHWLPCPKILCMVTKLWPMSQGASHLERSDLKLFEDRGFRVLRVHDVTSSIVDTSCNNLPRYSTRRYVFLPDDIELRWRELCQRTSRPLHKTHSPSVFYTKCPAKPQRLSKTLSLESGCTHTRPSVRGDGPKHAVLPTTGK